MSAKKTTEKKRAETIKEKPVEKVALKDNFAPGLYMICDDEGNYIDAHSFSSAEELKESEHCTMGYHFYHVDRLLIVQPEVKLNNEIIPPWKVGGEEYTHHPA